MERRKPSGHQREIIQRGIASFRSDFGTNGVSDFFDNSILRTRDLSGGESFRRGSLLLWGSFHLEDFRFRAKRLWKKKRGGVREICGRSDGGGSNFLGQDGNNEGILTKISAYDTICVFNDACA